MDKRLSTIGSKTNLDGYNVTYSVKQGIVISTKESSETYINTQTKSTYVPNVGWINHDSVIGDTVNRTVIWVKFPDGKEDQFTIYQHSVKAREGHDVTMLFANDGFRKHLVGICNDTTNSQLSFMDEDTFMQMLMDKAGIKIRKKSGRIGFTSLGIVTFWFFVSISAAYPHQELYENMLLSLFCGLMLGYAPGYFGSLLFMGIRSIKYAKKQYSIFKSEVFENLKFLAQ